MTPRLKYALAIFLNLFIISSAHSQWTGPKKKPTDSISIKYGPLTPRHRTDAAMEAFRSYGLGQMIHWGVYSITGNATIGAIPKKDADPANLWMTSNDSLLHHFNPKDFDAKRWAKQAKNMGAKYVIFTTKHHDGFALWPSKYSDYSVAQTPYKKDIVKQIVDAYTAESIDVFLYFSVLEYTNPNYIAKVPQTDEEKQQFDKFLQYTRNQLLELLANYPQIKGFWFDGTWDASWKSAYVFSYNLEKELRQKHPGLIIGSRFRNDEFGERHFDSNGNLLGDYEQGWERKLPAEFEWLNGNDWDVVMTIEPNGWGYIKDWSKFYTKTTDDLLEMLMHAVSMNGNFVLNFGPNGDGNMRPEEDNIAKEIGEWMKVNAEAVYGVQHAALTPSKLGYFTQKDDNLYLTVFNRPVNNIVRIAVPKNAKQVPGSAALLLNAQQLEVKHSEIGLDLDKDTYYDVILPKGFQSEKAFVIKMKLAAPKARGTKLMDAKT